MHLSRFPRLHFAHLPTPLEPMTRLSEALGGPNLWIKRDDCTGLSSGGNKTRKLEFLMADALQNKVDTIITLGGTQSNHARQKYFCSTLMITSTAPKNLSHNKVQTLHNRCRHSLNHVYPRILRRWPGR